MINRCSLLAQLFFAITVTCSVECKLDYGSHYEPSFTPDLITQVIQVFYCKCYSAAVGLNCESC